MNRIRRTGAAVALVLPAILSLAPARAQDAPVAGDPTPFAAAWQDVLENEGTLLTPPQFVRLTNLAYQTAVVRVCNSLTMDKGAVSRALGEFLDSPDPALTDVQVQERTAAILIAFGARYGLFIAEAHLNTAAFCATAAEMKANPDNTPVLLK